LFDSIERKIEAEQLNAEKRRQEFLEKQRQLEEEAQQEKLLLEQKE
jgi:hypothetical protein